MKKTLVLASLLAAFGAASAQTSVTVGGVTGFGYQRDKASPSLVETDMAVVFKGTEQLGGGLSAAFSLELDNGSGTGTFRAPVTRKNTSISLTGGFGAVTVMNSRTSETANMAFVAPTALNTGFYDATVFGRVPMDFLGYSLPMGPLTLGASYSETGAGVGSTANNLNTPMGTPAYIANSNTNKSVTLSARYTAGPLAIAAAYKHSDASSAVVLKRSANYELGATYDLGVAKIGIGFDSKPVFANYDAVLGVLTYANDASALAIGVSVPMGQTSFGVNYAKRDKANQLEAAVQHNLSARTNVNFSVGRYTAFVPATGLFAAKVGQYRVSLTHAF